MIIPQSVIVKLPWEDEPVEIKVTEEYAKAIKDYINDGNATEISDGIYATQVAQYCDRLTLRELVEEFFEEYIPRDEIELLIIKNTQQNHA